jgi:O-antigen ligase
MMFGGLGSGRRAGATFELAAPAGFACLFVCSLAAAFLAPAWMLSTDMLPVAIIGNLFVLLLCVVAALSRSGERPRNLTFALWWVLMSSEEFFVHRAETETTMAGHFAPEAYAEASIWVMVFAAALVLTFRDSGYLKLLLRGPYRWLALYGALCLASCAWAIRPVFTAAWSFKLALTILLLTMCASRIREEEDLKSFLKVTLWGLAFVTIVPPLRALFYPGPIFEDGRLGTSISPTGLSGMAATLLLTALAAGPLLRARWVGVLGVAGAGVMFLAGGKTAILGGVLSAVLFFAVQRRVGAAVGVFAGLAVLGAMVISVTPVSSYLRNYLASGEASTLTGRTGLWDLAFPLIVNRPLTGYGYASSRFVSVQVGGVIWDPANLHNGFLEALFNNGLLGLALVLAIQCAIIARLARVVRLSGCPASLRTVAIGGGAMLLNVLVAGMSNAVFGGRAEGPFVTMLALITISERLAYVAQRSRAPEAIRGRSPQSPITDFGIAAESPAG